MRNGLSCLYVVLSSGLLHLLCAPSGAAPQQVTWTSPIEVASGGGYKGPWRMNESHFNYVDDPTVAVSDEGIVAVAWVDQFQKDVFFQTYTPEGKERLAEPVNVSRSPRVFSWLPKMVIASGDPINVYVLWQEIIFSGGTHGGDILFARSKDGGRTFSDAINLSNDIAGSGKGRLSTHRWHNGSLDLARGADGRLYAAWTEYEGALWFSHSTDGGRRFASPLRVSRAENGEPARGPSLAVGEQGAVYLAWSVGEDPGADIHFATSTDHGVSFGEPRVVLRSDAQSDAPKLSVDAREKLHLVYAENPQGLLARPRVHYAWSADGGATFEGPVDISTPETGPNPGASYPALRSGGANHLYVVWDRLPRRGARARGLAFTCSNDAGQSFAPAMVVPGSLDPGLGFNGSLQGSLMKKLAVNRRGTVAVVNSTFKRDVASHVWLFLGQAASNEDGNEGSALD